MDGKAINRKRQAVNGFSAPDPIKQLENRPPKGNWRRFNSMDTRATEIIQTWKQVSTGRHISIGHFCPWRMKKTMEKKKNTADNCKSALKVVSPVVQGYLSLTENFAKDDIIIDAYNTGMGRHT